MGHLTSENKVDFWRGYDGLKPSWPVVETIAGLGLFWTDKESVCEALESGVLHPRFIKAFSPNTKNYGMKRYKELQVFYNIHPVDPPCAVSACAFYLKTKGIVCQQYQT